MNSIYPYAGFWKRFAARMIDGIILYFAYTIIQQILVAFSVMPQMEHLKENPEMALQAFTAALPALSIMFTLSTVLPWIYYACMESSKLQASVGKLALGIKVVDANGQRLTFGRALGRTLAKIISGLTLNIGYFMAGATRKKQALHDKMANAYVVDKKFNPGDPMPEVQTHFGLLTAAIVAEVLALLLCFAAIIGLTMFVISKVKELPNNVSVQQPPAIEQSIDDYSD